MKTLINKLIKMEAPLDSFTDDDIHVAARKGDVELLKCMFNRGVEKDSKIRTVTAFCCM